MFQSFLRKATARGFSAFLLASIPTFAISTQQVEVSGELASLSETHGFTVIGLAQTEDAFGRAEGDELYPRLRSLLEDFDYVIVQDATGGVNRVIVLGEKVPFEPSLPTPDTTAEDSEIEIRTERRGSQHVVRASLGGRGGVKIERELHLDTGADYLVLPLSLLTELGLDEQSLKEREMQTANGKVKAQIGILPSLWLGERSIENVETAFLEDGKLGSSGLLGMSVLGRFKVTIDEDKNSIILDSKEKGADAEESDEAEGGSKAPGDRRP